MKSRIFLLLTSLILLNSCAESGNEQVSTDSGMRLKEVTLAEGERFTPPLMDEKGPNIAAAAQTNAAQPVEKARILKEGKVVVKTDDIAPAKNELDQLVKAAGAYYASERLEHNTGSVDYSLHIRVPANGFEAFILALEKGPNEVMSKEIEAKDVTEEFVDLETRLATKREYMKRYRELLAKAGSVKDLLAIEEQIRALQEEIESAEGRLRYLTDRVSYSSLHLKLYQVKEFVYKPEAQDSFFERVKRALHTGWTAVVGFLILLITLWPFILLGVGVVVLLRVVRQRRRGRSMRE